MYKNNEYAVMQSKGWENPLILKLEAPFLVGMVNITKKDREVVESFEQQISRGMPCAKVEDFAIYIVPQRSLSGDIVPREVLKETMEEMAEYYRDAVIVSHPGRFKSSAENMEGVLEERRVRNQKIYEQETQRRFEKAKKELFG